jgi:hypothetical protein
VRTRPATYRRPTSARGLASREVACDRGMCRVGFACSPSASESVLAVWLRDAVEPIGRLHCDLQRAAATRMEVIDANVGGLERVVSDQWTAEALRAVGIQETLHLDLSRVGDPFYTVSLFLTLLLRSMPCYCD